MPRPCHKGTRGPSSEEGKNRAPGLSPRVTRGLFKEGQSAQVAHLGTPVRGTRGPELESPAGATPGPSRAGEEQVRGRRPGLTQPLPRGAPTCRGWCWEQGSWGLPQLLSQVPGEEAVVVLRSRHLAQAAMGGEQTSPPGNICVPSGLARRCRAQQRPLHGSPTTPKKQGAHSHAHGGGAPSRHQRWALNDTLEARARFPRRVGWAAGQVSSPVSAATPVSVCPNSGFSFWGQGSGKGQGSVGSNCGLGGNLKGDTASSTKYRNPESSLC